MNEDGVAILKPGQYRGSHNLRLHQGKYLALGQKNQLKYIEMIIETVNMIY